MKIIKNVSEFKIMKCFELKAYMTLHHAFRVFVHINLKFSFTIF